MSRPARPLTMLCSPVFALCSAAVPAVVQAGERPIAFSTRTATPPVIDGRLDDAVWQSARPTGELVQVEPVLGVPCSERTEIRFLHDSEQLYLFIRCFDSEPERILGTSHERDAFLDVDDRVEIVFDTFHDRRNAFFFQMNAEGSKGDALITNNGANFNKPWDGIWDGHATIDEHGWSAELALPFKTLNFKDGETVWGFNIERYIGRKRENARWASASRDYRLFNIYQSGELRGLEGLQQGIGLDVVPFFVSHWQNDREDGDKTLLGGKGTLWGPIIGATLFHVVKEVTWTYLLGWQWIALGLLIIINVVYFQQGIMGWMREKWPERFGIVVDTRTTISRREDAQ